MNRRLRTAMMLRDSEMPTLLTKTVLRALPIPRRRARRPAHHPIMVHALRCFN